MDTLLYNIHISEGWIYIYQKVGIRILKGGVHTYVGWVYAIHCTYIYQKVGCEYVQRVGVPCTYIRRLDVHLSEVLMNISWKMDVVYV